MTDGNETFESTKARLEEILAQVRKKDTSLEQSLELLEEGVRLANRCNELIDQTSWRPVTTEEDAPEGDVPDEAPAPAQAEAEPAADGSGADGCPEDAAVVPIVDEADEAYVDDERA